MKLICVEPINHKKDWYKIDDPAMTKKESIITDQQYVLRAVEPCYIKGYDSWTFKTNISIHSKDKMILITNAYHESMNRNIIVNSLVLTTPSGEYKKECRPILFNIGKEAIEYQKGDIICSINIHTHEDIQIHYPTPFITTRELKVSHHNNYYKFSFFNSKKSYRCYECREFMNERDIVMCSHFRCFHNICKKHTVCKHCKKKHCSRHSACLRATFNDNENNKNIFL